jgi:hypothetical protein
MNDWPYQAVCGNNARINMMWSRTCKLLKTNHCAGREWPALDDVPITKCNSEARGWRATEEVPAFFALDLLVAMNGDPSRH